MDEQLRLQVEEWKIKHADEMFYCKKNRCHLRVSACEFRQKNNKTVTHYYISPTEKRADIEPEFVVCKGCSRWLNLKNGGQYYRKPPNEATKTEIEKSKEASRKRRKLFP